MIIVSYQWHYKVSNPAENTEDSYFIAVFFCRGIDESRDRFKHFMESEPGGKVGSFFDITRITWSYRHHTIRSFEIEKKSNFVGDFLHTIILIKFQKICLSSKTVIWESFMTFRKFVTFVLQRM